MTNSLLAFPLKYMNCKKISEIDESKYTCPICDHGFDKPKVKYFSNFGVEIIVWIVGILLLGPIGAIIGVIFSLVRFCSRRKVCPHCESAHFIKNY